MSNLNYYNSPYYSLIILKSTPEEYHSHNLKQSIDNLESKTVHFVKSETELFEYAVICESFTRDPGHLSLHNDCFSSKGIFLYEEAHRNPRSYRSSLKVRVVKKSSLTPQFCKAIKNKIIILESKLEDKAFLIFQESKQVVFEELLEVLQIDLNETLENNDRNQIIIVHQYPESGIDIERCFTTN